MQSSFGEHLPPFAEIENRRIDESSGLVKSRRYAGVYWTLNDSGDWPRIYAMGRDGRSVLPPDSRGEPRRHVGVFVQGAANVDWESIALNDRGELIIADSGNNTNRRRDLALYFVPEPDPRAEKIAQVTRRVGFHYPDQMDFEKPAAMDFDCEAIFFARGSVYFISKNRSRNPAKLYRLDEENGAESVPLSLLASRDLGGAVTGADASADGLSLAVLTYRGCWVFRLEAGAAPRDDNYFAGAAYFKAFRAGQCEAVCWDGPEALLISNEDGKLFELDLADIPPVALGEPRSR